MASESTRSHETDNQCRSSAEDKLNTSPFAQPSMTLERMAWDYMAAQGRPGCSMHDVYAVVLPFWCRCTARMTSSPAREHRRVCSFPLSSSQALSGPVCVPPSPLRAPGVLPRARACVSSHSPLDIVTQPRSSPFSTEMHTVRGQEAAHRHMLRPRNGSI